MSNVDEQEFNVDEQVVLQKFDGEPLPENEVERITILNGEIVAHERVENGETVGPVEDSEIVGADVGRLFSIDSAEEVE